MVSLTSSSHRFLVVARHVVFWFSNVALLIITTFSALNLTLGRASFPVATREITWEKIPAFFPTLTVLLVIVSALYLVRTKRSSLLFKLFFAVELPLLLIGFARVVFNVYPSTVLFLTVVTLFSSVCIWYDILWGQRKTKFNERVRQYFFLPYLTSTILSGWVFLMWVFWVPYAGWLVFSNIHEIAREILQSALHTWLGISAIVTLVYFLLSPALVFGMLFREAYKFSFPRKQLVVFAGVLVVIGCTFVLDTLEKRGPQADLYEAARKLHITATTNVVPFTREDLSTISNFNRLHESTRRVYLAGLKYPIHSMVNWKSKEKTNYIRDAVRQTYCPQDCKLISRAYEALFFPLVYEGDIIEDRALAEKVYAYVFDGSLQNDNADKISRLKKRSILGNIGWNAGWNSVEASAIKQYDTSVHLDSVRYEVAVNKEVGVYTNLITYAFRNTTPYPQEVYMEFLLPDTHAVITDLRLGANLELPSTVAPRGAAKRVYERSVQNRIDPALLEQVGPRQYRLRVFPIPGNGLTAEGTQKVQVEYTAFLGSDGNMSVTMPMTTRNLGIDRQTIVEATAEDEEGRGLNLGILGYRDITRETALQVARPLEEPRFAIAGPENTLITFTREVQDAGEPTVFFLDNSASANTREVRDSYQELRREYEGTAAFYTYNFQVQTLSQDEEIAFWGPTDSSVLAEVLTDPKFAGQRIVVVKDGSNVETDAREGIDLNYAQIHNIERIDFLVVGNAVPIFKNELTMAAAATQNEGTVHLISQKNVGDQTGRFDVEWSTLTRQSNDGLQKIEEPKWREALEDLWAFSLSKEQIRTIENAETWEKAASRQAIIATKAHIVNHLASLIALETDRQRQALEREMQSENKYRSDHDIGEVTNQALFLGQSADEPHLFTLFVVLLLLSIPFIRNTIRSRKELLAGNLG